MFKNLKARAGAAAALVTAPNRSQRSLSTDPQVEKFFATMAIEKFLAAITTNEILRNAIEQKDMETVSAELASLFKFNTDADKQAALKLIKDTPWSEMSAAFGRSTVRTG